MRQSASSAMSARGRSTAAAAAETIDDVTYRSCTRPVTVAVVTVSSSHRHPAPPRLTRDVVRSFVRDRRLLGRRRQPLGMESGRVRGMEGRDDVIQSASVVCGISREFDDDEDGVSWAAACVARQRGDAFVLSFNSTAPHTHTHTHTHARTQPVRDSDE